jgi:hypothetical protein
MIPHLMIQARLRVVILNLHDTWLSNSWYHISVWNQTAFASRGATGSRAAAAPAVILWAGSFCWGGIRRPRPRGIRALGPGSWPSSISWGAATTMSGATAATTAWSRPVGHISFSLFCRATAASWAGAAMSSTVTASHWTAWPAPASVSPWVPVNMHRWLKFL